MPRPLFSCTHSLLVTSSFPSSLLLVSSPLLFLPVTLGSLSSIQNHISFCHFPSIRFCYYIDTHLYPISSHITSISHNSLSLPGLQLTMADTTSTPTWFERVFACPQSQTNDDTLRAMLYHYGLPALQPQPAGREDRRPRKHTLCEDDVLVRVDLIGDTRTPTGLSQALHENMWWGSYARSPVEDDLQPLFSLPEPEPEPDDSTVTATPDQSADAEDHDQQPPTPRSVLPHRPLDTNILPARHLIRANDHGEHFLVVPRPHRREWIVEGCSHCLVTELAEARLLPHTMPPPLLTAGTPGAASRRLQIRAYKSARRYLDSATHPEKLCPFHFHHVLTGERLTYAEAVVLDHVALREDMICDWSLARARVAAAWFEELRSSGGSCSSRSSPPVLPPPGASPTPPATPPPTYRQLLAGSEPDDGWDPRAPPPRPIGAPRLVHAPAASQPSSLGTTGDLGNNVGHGVASARANATQHAAPGRSRLQAVGGQSPEIDFSVPSRRNVSAPAVLPVEEAAQAQPFPSTAEQDERGVEALDQESNTVTSSVPPAPPAPVTTIEPYPEVNPADFARGSRRRRVLNMVLHGLRDVAIRRRQGAAAQRAREEQTATPGDGGEGSATQASTRSASMKPDGSRMSGPRLAANRQHDEQILFRQRAIIERVAEAQRQKDARRDG